MSEDLTTTGHHTQGEQLYSVNTSTLPTTCQNTMYVNDPLFSELLKLFQVTIFLLVNDVFNKPYADTKKLNISPHYGSVDSVFTDVLSITAYTPSTELTVCGQ